MKLSIAQHVIQQFWYRFSPVQRGKITDTAFASTSKTKTWKHCLKILYLYFSCYNQWTEHWICIQMVKVQTPLQPWNGFHSSKLFLNHPLQIRLPPVTLASVVFISSITSIKLGVLNATTKNKGCFDFTLVHWNFWKQCNAYSQKGCTHFGKSWKKALNYSKSKPNLWTASNTGSWSAFSWSWDIWSRLNRITSHRLWAALLLLWKDKK